jgi:hypothetical protein
MSYFSLNFFNVPFGHQLFGKAFSLYSSFFSVNQKSQAKNAKGPYVKESIGLNLHPFLHHLKTN